MKTLIYDIEVYPNHTCVNYCDINEPDVIKTIDGIAAIRKINLRKYKWIGFNARKYDHVILEKICRGISQQETFELSKDIIHDSEEFYFSFAENLIDLYEICPKMSRCSLKEFGHRMQYPFLENLPYEYDKVLSDEEWENVKNYGKHDVRITYMLWEKLKGEQDSREALKMMYDVKLFGGAPRLAEKCILSKLQDERILSTLSFVDPGNLKLSEPAKALYDVFKNNDYKKGLTPEVKKELSREYKYGDLTINFGVGGLHAFTKPAYYQECYDYDITSYYPSIILNCKLGSPMFRAIYKDIYDKRIEYKRLKDKRADGLKLILNSLYGKLTDKFSDPKIRAPIIGINICILGQFYLLDLIEKIGSSVIYANTDGLLTSKPVPQEILSEFEARTGFKLEMKKINKLILKDVNSYYAVYEDGSIKPKKEFLENMWSHNTRAPIIARSVVKSILEGIPIEQTITESINPFDFMYFSKAKTYEGAKLFLDDTELTDAKVRFWIAREGGVLRRTTEERMVKNKLKKATNVRIVKDNPVELVMDITKANFNNLDKDYYIMKAYELYNVIMGDKNV